MFPVYKRRCFSARSGSNRSDNIRFGIMKILAKLKDAKMRIIERSRNTNNGCNFSNPNY